MNTLNGRALKVTIVLDPAEVVALTDRAGQPHTVLRIQVNGRKHTRSRRMMGQPMALSTIVLSHRTSATAGGR